MGRATSASDELGLSLWDRSPPTAVAPVFTGASPATRAGSAAASPSTRVEPDASSASLPPGADPGDGGTPSTTGLEPGASAALRPGPGPGAEPEASDVGPRPTVDPGGPAGEVESGVLGAWATSAADAAPEPRGPEPAAEVAAVEVGGLPGAEPGPEDSVRGVTRTRAGLPMTPKVEGTGSSMTSTSTWSERRPSWADAAATAASTVLALASAWATRLTLSGRAAA
jgi:hypothetical protein